MTLQHGNPRQKNYTTFQVDKDTHLSIFVMLVPCIGVFDVRISFKHVLMDHSFYGDLDVDLDQGGRDVGRIFWCQLQLEDGEVSFCSRRVVDEVHVVLERDAFLKSLRLHQNCTFVRILALK